MISRQQSDHEGPPPVYRLQTCSMILTLVRTFYFCTVRGLWKHDYDLLYFKFVLGYGSV